MCVYYFLHYHHQEPCHRDVDYEVQYLYCPSATTLSDTQISNYPGFMYHGPNPFTQGHLENYSYSQIHQGTSLHENIRQPCDDQTYAPELLFFENGNMPLTMISIPRDESDPDNHHYQQYYFHGRTSSSSPPPPPPPVAVEVAVGSCDMAGCLISPRCSAGSCRLEDLGGRWKCCRCERGANLFTTCVHPMKNIPDTLCYHIVCQECQPDDASAADS